MAVKHDIQVFVKSVGLVPLTTLKSFTERELLLCDNIGPAYIRKLQHILGLFGMQLSMHNSGALTHFIVRKRETERAIRRTHYDMFVNDPQIMNRIMSDPVLQARFAPRDETVEEELARDTRLA